jgi:hypothetical protein
MTFVDLAGGTGDVTFRIVDALRAQVLFFVFLYGACRIVDARCAQGGGPADDGAPSIIMYFLLIFF